MKKYIKTERNNLFEPNDYISMIVELRGNIFIDKSKEAVVEAYRNNESTMSRIVLEKDGSAYYEKMENTGCKVFDDNRDWQDILHESERNPFALWDGELICTYINTDGDKTTLFILAHHLSGDGKSIVSFINQVIRKLSGEKLTYCPMELLDDEWISTTPKLPLALRLIAKNVNHKWDKLNRAFSWDDYIKIHNTYWSSRESNISIEEYNENEIADMKKYCKNGITMNSYLVTILMSKFTDSKHIGIPISIRNNNETMSNQTSGISIKYSYNQNISFEQNLSIVHRKINKKLNNEHNRYFILPFMASYSPTLIDAVLLESQKCYSNKISRKLAKFLGYLDRFNIDLGITNLTRIDIPNRYDNFQVENITFIPPKISYTDRVVGIGTYHNKLTIAYHNINHI